MGQTKVSFDNGASKHVSKERSESLAKARLHKQMDPRSQSANAVVWLRHLKHFAELITRGNSRL